MARLEARNARAFRIDPGGGYLAGESWFYFAFDASLFGYVIWGSPTPEDVRALVRLLVVELDRPLHDALVDLGGLEAVDPDAFTALARYTVEQASALARIIRRTAIVRPAGLNGAIVTGFFDTVPSLQADLPKQPGTYTLAQLHATVCHEAPRGTDCAAARGTLVVRAVAPPCFEGGNDDPRFGGYVPDEHCGRLGADLVAQAEPEAAPGPRASGRVTIDYENKRVEDTCTTSFGKVGFGP